MVCLLSVKLNIFFVDNEVISDLRPIFSQATTEPPAYQRPCQEEHCIYTDILEF